MRANAWLLSIGAVTTGCFGGEGGSDSGVPGSTRLPELTSAQRSSLCEHLADVFPSRTVACEDFTLTLGFTSANQCVSQLPTSPSCSATVDQVEACYEAIAAIADEDICMLELPAACTPLSDDGCIPPEPDEPS